MKELNFIIIFILFFCYIFCKKKIDTVSQTLETPTMTTKNFNDSAYFQVSFKTKFIRSFQLLNIQINNKDESGHLAFYSKVDTDCMPYRSQMSINYKDYNLRDELFYLCVYCLNDLNCNYEVTFNLSNSTIIPNNINFFNYYSYENNQTFYLSF